MTALKRSLNATQLSIYGMGTMVGAGIYVLVGKVAGIAGLYVPFAFLLSAIIVAFSAFSYGQLASRFPKSAGEAVYVKAAFDFSWLACVVGVAILLTGIVSAAALARGFSGYFQAFLAIDKTIVIVGLVVTITIISFWGVIESVNLAIVITLVEVAGILVVLLSNGENLINQPELWAKALPPLDISLWPGLLAAAFLAFYAFIGFEDMVNMAEELKEPEKNINKAILWALVGTSVLYVAVALVAIATLSVTELKNSDAPFIDLMREHPWMSPQWMGLIGMVAIVNGAMVQLIMGARVMYGMACQGWLPQIFAHVHATTKTPWLATVTIGGLILCFALLLPLVTLAKITSGIILLVFSLVNLSAWKILRLEQAALTKQLFIP